MTEDLMQKLEEKALSLLAELELLRREVKQLRSENSFLKTEKLNSSKKLEELLNSLTMSDVRQTKEMDFAKPECGTQVTY